MHPAALVGKAGLERTRIQVYDAPLTTAPTDAITIHHGGVANAYGSQPAVSVFDDRGDYTRPYLDDGHSDGGAILPAGERSCG